MRIESVMWCALFALAGCASTPKTVARNYGKELDTLKARVERLETEVALLNATPKDDAYACPPEVDCD